LAVLGHDNPRWQPASFGYKLCGFETGIRFPVGPRRKPQATDEVAAEDKSK
jgi:hypothetical protein